MIKLNPDSPLAYARRAAENLERASLAVNTNFAGKITIEPSLHGDNIVIRGDGQSLVQDGSLRATQVLYVNTETAIWLVDQLMRIFGLEGQVSQYLAAKAEQIPAEDHVNF